MFKFKCKTQYKDVTLTYTFWNDSFKEATQRVKEWMLDGERLVSVVRMDGNSLVEEKEVSA